MNTDAQWAAYIAHRSYHPSLRFCQTAWACLPAHHQLRAAGLVRRGIVPLAHVLFSAKQSLLVLLSDSKIQ